MYWSFNSHFIRHGNATARMRHTIITRPVLQDLSLSIKVSARDVLLSPLRTARGQVELAVCYCRRSHDFTVRPDVTSYAWSPFLFLPMTGVEAWCGQCESAGRAIHIVCLLFPRRTVHSVGVGATVHLPLDNRTEWEWYVFSRDTRPPFVLWRNLRAIIEIASISKQIFVARTTL